MTYPLGIDVSKSQASQDGTRVMDWQRAKDAGIQFAFVRATYGASYVDPQFAFNWSELRRLGIPHGAYHYFRPKEDALLQAQEFVDIVDPQGGERLVLDVENAGGLDRNTLTKCVIVALETIKGLTGRYPLMYSRYTWLDANIDMAQLPKLDWWLAQYKFANPYPFYTDMYPTDKLTAPIGVERQQIKFHQGSEKGNGKRRGAQSYYIDLDAFLGTDEELASYFAEDSVPASYSVYLPIVVKPEPPKPDHLEVTPYSQNDPRWKNNRLGTSSTTIGWNGCLITCCAMIAKYFGKDTDPAKFNTWLTANNGYWNGNLYVWNSLHRLYPDIDINVWEDCIYVPAPLSQIDAALGRGEPVIVHVDFVPSTSVINDHYVLLIGKLADEDYTMIDPWDGFVGSFKSRYKDAKRFIFRIVSYKRG